MRHRVVEGSREFAISDPAAWISDPAPPVATLHPNPRREARAFRGDVSLTFNTATEDGCPHCDWM